MKNLITCIITSFVILHCAAQTKLTPGEIKGTADTFVVFRVRQFDSAKFIGVYSKSNKYNNGVPRSPAQKSKTFLPMDPRKDIHVHDDAIKQVIFNALKDKLPALRKNKEQISLILLFEPSGKITDIIFDLKENTLITIKEIEKIDHLLRKDIKANFTGNQYKYYTAINYNVPVIIF